MPKMRHLQLTVQEFKADQLFFAFEIDQISSTLLESHLKIFQSHLEPHLSKSQAFTSKHYRQTWEPPYWSSISQQETYERTTLLGFHFTTRNVRGNHPTGAPFHNRHTKTIQLYSTIFHHLASFVT